MSLILDADQLWLVSVLWMIQDSTSDNGANSAFKANISSSLQVRHHRINPPHLYHMIQVTQSLPLMLQGTMWTVCILRFLSWGCFSHKEISVSKKPKPYSYLQPVVIFLFKKRPVIDWQWQKAGTQRSWLTDSSWQTAQTWTTCCNEHKNYLLWAGICESSSSHLLPDLPQLPH